MPSGFLEMLYTFTFPPAVYESVTESLLQLYIIIFETDQFNVDKNEILRLL